MKDTRCRCDGYDPKDPDDVLCYECTCGHVEDEHDDNYQCRFRKDD